MINQKFQIEILREALKVLPFILLIACQKTNSPQLTDIEKRGKAVYMANCISCHNPDPRLQGSVGPDIAGSSLELVTARVLHQSYPQGYHPKRPTGLCPNCLFYKMIYRPSRLT